MHHRTPPSKTGWSNLNLIFPPVMRLAWTTQNSDHPGDYWSNSWANLGRPPPGFRLYQELSNWASQVNELGTSFLEIWTCGSSPQSGSRNAWTRIKNVNGASRHSNFWNFIGANQMISSRARLVTMDETWLYHYAQETAKIEWRHSGSPRPIKFRVQKTAGKFRASMFEIKTVSSSLIIFQRAKLSTWSFTNLSWCNWMTFWRKNATEKSASGPCSCITMPRLTGHLQPRRNWPTWASIVLIIHPILRIWPHRTTACSLDWKKTIERSAFFVRRGGHCCRGDLVEWTIFWIFLWVACKRATS